MNIVISPFSSRVNFENTDKINPKNYPYWRELVGLLRLDGHQIYQIGVNGEQLIGANWFLADKKFSELKKIIIDTHFWISVDNFLPHFVNSDCYKKKGIVIFSQSDPKIFGYDYNINILKDKKYLRANQFDVWTNTNFDINSFVGFEDVKKIVDKHIKSLFK